MSTALRTYARGHSLVTVDDDIANESRVYHFDHQGTTQCLTDATGAVTDRFASDAWGVEVKRSGSSSNPYWYSGESGYYRAASDHYYVRRRQLSAPHAAWLSLDPLRPLPDGTGYAYLAGHPISGSDPSGLCGTCCCCGTGLTYTRSTASYLDYFTDPKELTKARCLLRLLKQRNKNVETMVAGIKLVVTAAVNHPDASNNLPCSMEWWECSGRESGKWIKKDLTNPKVITGSAWRDYLKAQKDNPCLGAKSYALLDLPGMSTWNARYNTGSTDPCAWVIGDPVTADLRLFILVRLRDQGCMPECKTKANPLSLIVSLGVREGIVVKAPTVDAGPAVDPTEGSPCPA